MTASQTSVLHASPLLALCDELLLHICTFLDVPELLILSRICHRLRQMALDPVLHHTRLFTVTPFILSYHLSNRPALSSLCRPSSTIYQTSGHVFARSLNRSLVSIRLNLRLARRPSPALLVKRNILPPECCRLDPATGETVYGGAGSVAPGLVGLKRRVERERVKDRLRHWLGLEKRLGVLRLAMQRGWVGHDQEDPDAGCCCGETGVSGDGGAAAAGGRGRASVRYLVQRFARRARAGAGIAAGPDGKTYVNNHVASATRRYQHRQREEATREAPTRAHVLGLRRFWERVGKEGG